MKISSQEVYASDDIGPPISDKLAKFTDKNFESALKTEKLKTLLNKYKRPQNFVQLYVPKVSLKFVENCLVMPKRRA